MEEVPGVEHVDPGVAAAVEAGQEHGDDEGGGCGTEARRCQGTARGAVSAAESPTPPPGQG